MNVLIAPDSFKGTLTSAEAARAMAAGVRNALPDAQVHLLPMADGGEGTLDVVLQACGGERRVLAVTGMDGRPLRTGYAVVQRDGIRSAVIEVARVVGLGMAGSGPLAVGSRDTRGVGEMMRHALDDGLRHFLIGLGGSATNDGGAGLLAALGVAVRDADGRALVPNPDGLAALHALDFSGLDPRVAECAMTLLTDVGNPLCGRSGATLVYGPQKGVTQAEVAPFDARLQKLAALGDAWAGAAVSCCPGAGAAGGLGYALQLLGARYAPGAEFLCDLLELGKWLGRANLLITGEGRTDRQSFEGKAPLVVAERARAAGVEAVLVSGSIDAALRTRLQKVFAQCLALDEMAGMQLALSRPARCLQQACQDLLGALPAPRKPRAE